MIKVSVVMAVYNAERFLRQALDSILDQTLKEIEVICVDDGSTDASPDILQEYKERDRRVRVYRNDIPSDGAGLARNIGVSYAQGKYLSVLDADDYFEPDMLEGAYNRLEETGADVVMFSGWMFNERMEIHNMYCIKAAPRSGGNVFSPREEADRLFQYSVGYAWNCMERTDYVRRYQIHFEQIHHADDLTFTYMLLALAERIALLDVEYVHYRVGDMECQSAGVGIRYQDGWFKALEALKRELEKHGLFDTYKVTFGIRAFSYFSQYISRIQERKQYIQIYNLFKEECMEKWGINGIADDQMPALEKKQRDEIRQMTADEFAFKNGEDSTLAGQLHVDIWKAYRFFGILPKHCSVALYGAGSVGKGLMISIMMDHCRMVTAWVDRDYQRIGYPVEAPEMLRERSFDYVVIAIDSEKVQKGVRTYLLSLGIENDRILDFKMQEE